MDILRFADAAELARDLVVENSPRTVCTGTGWRSVVSRSWKLARILRLHHEGVLVGPTA
jgi:hypothetical protein